MNALLSVVRRAFLDDVEPVPTLAEIDARLATLNADAVRVAEHRHALEDEADQLRSTIDADSFAAFKCDPLAMAAIATAEVRLQELENLFVRADAAAADVAKQITGLTTERDTAVQQENVAAVASFEADYAALAVQLDGACMALAALFVKQIEMDNRRTQVLIPLGKKDQYNRDNMAALVLSGYFVPAFANRRGPQSVALVLDTSKLNTARTNNFTWAKAAADAARLNRTGDSDVK